MCAFHFDPRLPDFTEPETSEKEVEATVFPGDIKHCPWTSTMWILGNWSQIPQCHATQILMRSWLLAPYRLLVFFIMLSLAYHRFGSVYNKETCQKCPLLHRPCKSVRHSIFTNAFWDLVSKSQGNCQKVTLLSTVQGSDDHYFSHLPPHGRIKRIVLHLCKSLVRPPNTYSQCI